MKLKFIYSIIIVALLFIAGFPTESHACKCSGPPSVEQELERSEAVFKGKIIDIKNKRTNRKILFEVEETWKGLSNTQIILTEELSSCSLDFFEGNSYLVDAYEIQGELTTNMCDRTKDLSDAGEDLLALGKGAKPTKEVNLKSQLQNPLVRYMYI